MNLSLSLSVFVRFLTPSKYFFYNCDNKIFYKAYSTKINCKCFKEKLIYVLASLTLVFALIVIFLQPSPKAVINVQIDHLVPFLVKLVPYFTTGSVISVQSMSSFFVNTKVFTIESHNSKTLFIIAMLLHALFVYIFILFSIYTIFMSTNTVMFTYLTIAYEIICEIFWWFIDNYILAPCPFLEDSDSDFFNGTSCGGQKLIEA